MAAYPGGYTIRYCKSLSGVTPAIVKRFPEAASQTFVRGDLVYRTGGYLEICGADPSLILGIALEDAHDDAADGTYEIDVLIITTDSLIKMEVHHTTPANQVSEDTDLGTLYGIAVSSGSWYIDKEETVNTRGRIQEFVEAVGTLNGEVLFQFLAANLEMP